MNKRLPGDLYLILPGACNAQCRDCSWKQCAPSANYIDELNLFLATWPEPSTPTNVIPSVLHLIGGEPTLSEQLDAVLELIQPYRKKFIQTILHTNGANLPNKVASIADKVDNVYITRRHWSPTRNKALFNTNQIPADDMIFDANRQLNQQGMWTYAEFPLDANIATMEDIYACIQSAKNINAHVVRFVHTVNAPADLMTPDMMHPLEQAFDIFVNKDQTSSLGKMTSLKLIDGMTVIWETKMVDTNLYPDYITQCYYHPNGRISSDSLGQSGFHLRDNILVRLLKKKKKKQGEDEPDLIDLLNNPPPVDGTGFFENQETPDALEGEQQENTFQQDDEPDTETGDDSFHQTIHRMIRARRKGLFGLFKKNP